MIEEGLCVVPLPPPLPPLPTPNIDEVHDDTHSQEGYSRYTYDQYRVAHYL